MTRTPASSDFAVQLRDALSARGVSHKALADRVRVSENTVTNWATGRYRPGHANLGRIAAALGMTLDELHGARVPISGRTPTTTGPPDDDLRGAEQIVRQLAQLEIETSLQTLQRVAPDLMRVLADARRHAARRRT